MRKHSATSPLARVAAVLVMSVALTGSFTVSAAAEDGPAQVLIRQDIMQSDGGRLKSIAGFLQDGTGTAEEAAALAKDLSIIAASLPMLFPEGTSSEDEVPRNRASEDIWKEWAKFEAAASTLSAEAAKLSEALASGDMDAARAQLQVTGKNGCGGCHQSFRLPEDS